MYKDEKLISSVRTFIERTTHYLYTYNFSWLGRPIIQFPQDMVAVQEIIWDVKPDFVIETGVAHGGGLMLYATVLEIIGKGKVIGIDIDIRKHNFREIVSHPLSHRIVLIEGSSVDMEVFDKVREVCMGRRNIVILDSLHTHEHVLKELELYSQLVRKGGYIIVFDTIIEFLPDNLFRGKPWGRGNNPKTAVDEFLRKNKRFKVDRHIEKKLLITTCPGGYLRCVKD